MNPSESRLTRDVQPQDFAGRGVRDHADERCLALDANHSLVRAYHGRADARLSAPFAARVSSRFLDVAPHAHARYGDAEGGEKMARGAQRQAERPRERRPSAHPPGLSASVDSLRVMPEGPPAVGASVSDNRDFIHVEVCHRLLGGSVSGEDLAAAALAGVGSFVGESLDLSGDEPYSSHGRELLSWGVL